MPFLRTVLLTLTLFSVASLAQDSRAVEILKRAQQAAGGVEALTAVKDKIVTRDIRAVGGGMSGRQVVKIVLPGAIRQESSLPFGMMILTLVDGDGKLQSPQGIIPLQGPQLTQAQGELFRIRERLLLADQTPELTLAHVASVDNDPRPAEVLQVTDTQAGQSIQLWIDRETGEFFKAAYDSVALVGAQRLEEHYSDFRSVNGVQTPFSVQVRSGDRLLTEIQEEKVLHNTGLTKAELR